MSAYRKMKELLESGELGLIIFKRTIFIAPGIEGINSMQIADAMYLPSWTGNTVLDVNKSFK